MLNSLSDASAAKPLLNKLSEFVSSEQSEACSWRYSSRGNYPEDLDDTACALIALQRSGKLRVDSSALASFAKNLISAEVAPGGPYKTWIRGGERHKDIDVAVNANIAYFLAMNGTFLDRLDAYLCEAASQGKFESLYYRSNAVFCYFLARYFALHPSPSAEKAKEVRLRLRSMAAEAMSSDSTSAQDLALCVSAMARLGASRQELSVAIERLLSLQAEDGLWPAAPLYIERVIEGKERCYSSKPLSSSFCVEALCLYLGLQSDNERQDPESGDLSVVTKIFIESFAEKASPFEAAARKQLERFAASGMDRFICLLPMRFLAALRGGDTDKDLALRLGAANLLGWTAYTIQDPAMDEKERLDELPLANVCMRRCLAMLTEACPDDPCRKYVAATFDAIDAANAAEAARPTEAPCAAALAERSFGHALGPLILFARLGHAPGSSMFAALEGFFRHYIVARQMSDDAHDWEDDLSSGKVNTAIQVLSRLIPGGLSPGKRSQAEMDPIRKAFWDKAIDRIARKIHYHAALARSHAALCADLVDQRFFDSLLAPVERSATRAVEERNGAVDFLERFKE